MRKVFVSGDFNILHPGHLRLLKFAKDSGDYLTVGVNSNDLAENKGVDQATRIEFVKVTSYVDEAFILKSSVVEYIEENRPDIVIKGREHENRYNLEQEAVDSYGGRLIFSSGETWFSSLTLLENEFKNIGFSNIQKPLEYIKRHSIDSQKLLDILDNFTNLDILVIGDVIIDEYITCEPLGMSREDPTIVVTPISSDIFLGGAGIVAAHASGLGAKVDFVSIVGDDKNSILVEDKLNEYRVKKYLYRDNTRTTTLKQRFRASGKTLLRVNNLKQHHISKDIQDMIISNIENSIKDKDLIVFSDFSYGCLPPRLINRIIEFGLKYDIMMVADSQSSSQTGDISKFNNMDIVTPTEREIRLGVNDFESGLVVLAEKLRNKSNIKNIFVTLGSEGLLIHANKRYNIDSYEEFITEQIPALNHSPKDVAGAGDSLLISSSMAVVSGASMIEGAYIGSLASALQIGRVGNMPLSIEELKKEIR